MTEEIVTRGGLTTVDQRAWNRGDRLTAIQRVRWPQATLHADRETVKFTWSSGQLSMPHSEVTALAHRPFYGRLPIPACAVSFETETGNEVLIFWTPRVHRLLLAFTGLGWDTGPYLDLSR